MPDVRVLGTLEVRVAGRLVQLSGRRAPALLALLAMRPGRIVGVGDVLGEVWGLPREAATEETARNAVQARVSALRRALGSGTLRAVEPGYLLDIPAESVDAARFDTGVRQARRLRAAGEIEQAAHAYEQALALWRGPTAYDGLLQVPALAGESVRLAELRLQALQESFALLVSAGRYDEIADELAAATQRHAGVEELWALRMIGLNAQGRQAAALAVYAEARERLRHSYGLDPGPRLRELEAGILRQDQPAGAGLRYLAPRRITRPATSFVGRENEVDLLLDLLRGSRMVTVTGPGGVGKTRLALEAAQRLVDSCSPMVAHGVAVLDLTTLDLTTLGLGRPTPARRGDDLAAVALDAVRPFTPGVQSARTLDSLCTLLADRQLLLVLDNCEHLVDDVAELAAALQSRTEAVTLLATSRELLRVPGETPLALKPLGAEPSLRLFLDRASALGPDDREPAARVCARLDGLPLALELAAGRAALLGIGEVARHLDDRARLLSHAPRTVAERHRSLAATIGWSYDLLDERDRRRFAVLSVFCGSFALDQAQEVLRRLGGPAFDAFDGLERLVARSMVQVERAQAGPARFRLLETIREYGAERLRESGVRAAAFEAHARVYAEFAERESSALFGAGQARAVSALTAESANVRAALDWAVEQGEGTLAQGIAGSLGYFIWMRGGRGPASRLAARAVELPGEDPAVTVRALAWLSHLDSVLGDLAQAVVYGERAAELEEALSGGVVRAGDLGFALLARAHALHRLNRWEEGDRVLAEATRVSAAAADQWALAGCAMVRGLHALSRGHLEDAELGFVEANGRYRRCGDRWGRQRASLRQALVWEARGDYAGAKRLLATAHGLIEDFDLPEITAPDRAHRRGEL